MTIRVWAGGYAHGGGLLWRLSVCPSVCLLCGKLVRAALTNHREIFGGSQGPCQECLSPELARSVKIQLRKGWEI